MAITMPGSNFDVQGLVSQLVSLEQAPLTQSKSRQSNYSNQISDLGKLRSALSDFQSAMRSLISGTALNVNKADVSDAQVLKASANSYASSGTYVVNVSALAASQTLALSSYDSGTQTGKIASASATLGNTAGDLTISLPSGDTTISLGADTSLQAISDAINAKGIDVSASVVNSGTEGYKLALSSKKSGSDGAFSVTGGAALGLSFLDYDRTMVDTGNPAHATNLAKRTAAPSDAELTINGVAITASSNKIAEAMTGLEVNLFKTGTSTITVSRDNDAVIKNVQSFVDGFNKVKSQVDGMYKQTSTAGAITDSSGRVIGTASRLDGSVRMMMQTLTAELGTGLDGVALESGFAYLNQIGISIQKDGSLKLDAEEFKKSLDKDPTAVARLFGNSDNNGFADRLNSRINDMLGPSGMMQVRTDSLNQQVTYEKQKQTQIQTRLDMMQTRLLKQFSALDASLATMKNQSSYMASMLG